MSKYIKLEDAIEIIRNEKDDVKIRDSNDMIFRSSLRLAKNVLLNMPTIDIVRCKDCKYYQPLDYNRPYDCSIGLPNVIPTDYCSYGEKKDDE